MVKCTVLVIVVLLWHKWVKLVVTLLQARGCMAVFVWHQSLLEFSHLTLRNPG